jgi:hypothetical protein
MGSTEKRKLATLRPSVQAKLGMSVPASPRYVSLAITTPATPAGAGALVAYVSADLGSDVDSELAIKIRLMDSGRAGCAAQHGPSTAAVDWHVVALHTVAEA